MIFLTALDCRGLSPLIFESLESPEFFNEKGWHGIAAPISDFPGSWLIAALLAPKWCF